MKQIIPAVVLLFFLAACCEPVEPDLPACASAPAEVPEGEDGETKYAALTFDDGPRADTTGLLLDGLAEGWKRQKPWNRSLAMLNDKQMIVCFLGPMLMEDPVCAPLEEKLREGWAARWPKEAYKTPSLAKLRKGFRPTFLGITLPFGGGDEEE